ncbi:MAG: DNA cytosine methyltransferase [Candidatus Nanopelagicales bacterium]
MRVKPTVVSLFSGAGGTDVGLERAGWEPVHLSDIDESAVQTLKSTQAAGIPIPGHARAYLEGARIVRADVRELGHSDVRPSGAGSTWRPALLAGGPPCQPWSSAGKQRGLADPRGQLLVEMTRMAAELRPHFVLLENVRGLLTAVGPTGRPGEILSLIQSGFEEIGYATRFAILNAADFGAPQRRVRLYMIATAEHRLPHFPEPSHSRAPMLGMEPWLTLRQALAAVGCLGDCDVVLPSGDRGGLIRSLAPGTGLKTGGVVENNRPGGHWGYKQDCFMADLDLPSRTIRAASTPDWVREDSGRVRRLTWMDCAALQGFPPEWRFEGSTASRFRQIGNAIQSVMAERIGEALLANLSTRRPHDLASARWPDEFLKRIRYTMAEHRTNGHHRVRVRVNAGVA